MYLKEKIMIREFTLFHQKVIIIKLYCQKVYLLAAKSEMDVARGR